MQRHDGRGNCCPWAKYRASLLRRRLGPGGSWGPRGSGAVARPPSPQGLRPFKLESMGNFPRSLAFVRANSARSSLVSFLLILVREVWDVMPALDLCLGYE